MARRALASWQRAQEARRGDVRSAARVLPNAKQIVENKRQQFDEAAARLPRALRANAQLHHTQFSRVAGRLAPQLLRREVERRRERFDGLTHRLKTGLAANTQAFRLRISRQNERVAAFGERSRRAMRNLIASRAARSERAGQLLAALSYRGVLSRGFALVRDGEGHPLRAAAAVGSGMRLDIEFADGRVGATADGAAGATERTPAAAAKPAVAKPRKPGGGSGQGSLFG